MLTLVARCVEAGEPVLLVGETGCGKTTVCQLLALLRRKNLHILNCHQHTETADFLGGYRPARGAERAAGAPFMWEDGPLVQARARKASAFVFFNVVFFSPRLTTSAVGAGARAVMIITRPDQSRARVARRRIDNM